LAGDRQRPQVPEFAAFGRNRHKACGASEGLNDIACADGEPKLVMLPVKD